MYSGDSKCAGHVLDNITVSIKGRHLCVYARMHVCVCMVAYLSITSVHSMDKFGGGIAEDPRECSVECDMRFLPCFPC